MPAAGSRTTAGSRGSGPPLIGASILVIIVIALVTIVVRHTSSSDNGSNGGTGGPADRRAAAAQVHSQLSAQVALISGIYRKEAQCLAHAPTDPHACTDIQGRQQLAVATEHLVTSLNQVNDPQLTALVNRVLRQGVAALTSRATLAARDRGKTQMLALYAVAERRASALRSG